MGRRYYLVADGERLYRDTVQAISTLAQKVANRTGEDVQVHYEDRIGRGKSHRKAPSKGTATYRRNPVKGRFFYRSADGHGSVYFKTLAQARRVAQAFANRMDERVQLLERPRDGMSPAIDHGAVYPSRVLRRNPASPRKIRKAKRSGQAKRGYYVEWKFGTHVERARYGNKGMATIKANALKRDGARSVRVYGA